MRLRPLSRPSAALALWMIGSSLVPLPARAGETAPTAALIAEARRDFTLNGKQIPPEIFRDFGDGDLADSGTIWVTVDVKTAIGSNLYFYEIRQNRTWISQKKVTANAGAGEETGSHISARRRTAFSWFSPPTAAAARATSSRCTSPILSRPRLRPRRQALRAHQPDELAQGRPGRPLARRDQHREKHNPHRDDAQGAVDETGARETMTIVARRR